MRSRNKLIIITGSQEFSGSAERIQSAVNPLLISGSCLARIEYGNRDGGPSNINHYTASSVIDVDGLAMDFLSVQNGHEILGPIARFKSTGSHSKWLVYQS